MGYDLHPKNKNVEALSIGAFSWPIFLQETGMGYVLGYGAGRSPGTYVYSTGNNGSPASNNGYKVSATEAKMMARIARGFISVQRFINKEWEAMPEDERKRGQEMKSHDGVNPLYKTGWHEDQLKKIEKFAEFAEKSGGFRIF